MKKLILLFLAMAMLVALGFLVLKAIKTKKLSEVEVLPSGKPVVALLFEGQDYILVDSKGSVLGTSNTTSLPILEVTRTGFSKSQLEFAANLYFELTRLYSIESAELEEDGVIIKMAGGMKVIFPLEGDIDVLLGAHRLILSRLNNADQEIRIGSIDLRFNNPVLR